MQPVRIHWRRGCCYLSVSQWLGKCLVVVAEKLFFTVILLSEFHLM